MQIEILIVPAHPVEVAGRPYGFVCGGVDRLSKAVASPVCVGPRRRLGLVIPGNEGVSANELEI